MRRILRRAASKRRTVTYGTLMNALRLSRGRALSATIGKVDRLEMTEGAPGFAAIIVRKDTGFPGGGYFVDDALPKQLVRAPARGADPRLTTAEKLHVRKRQRLIWAYYGRAARSRNKPTI